MKKQETVDLWKYEHEAFDEGYEPMALRSAMKR